MNEKSNMAEKAKGWLEILYKVGVLLGAVAMFWANATFAKRDDIQKLTDEVHSIGASINVTNEHVSQIKDRINQLIEVDRDHESRLRVIERTRP